MVNLLGKSWAWPPNVPNNLLGWDQDGGALQNVARESLNVYDFGAAGDGVTDDSAAIQAALDWVVAGGAAGRHLAVPGGQFKIVTKCSATLPNHSSASITGQGMLAGTFLVANAVGGLEILCSGSASFLYLANFAIVPALTTCTTLLTARGTYSGSGGPVDHHALVVDNINGSPLQRATSTYNATDPFVFTRIKRPLIRNLRYTAGAQAFTNGSGERIARTIGKATVDLSNCYDATIIGGKLGGHAEYGILCDFSGTVSTVEAGVTQNTEGFLATDLRLTSCQYGIALISPTRQPGWRIINNHINASKKNVIIDGGNRFQVLDNLLYSSNNDVYRWSKSGTTLTITCDVAHAIPNTGTRSVRLNFSPDYLDDGDDDGSNDVSPSGTYTATVTSTTVFTVTDALFSSLTSTGTVEVRWKHADFSDIEVRDGFSGIIANNMYGQQTSRLRRHTNFVTDASTVAVPEVESVNILDDTLSGATDIAPYYFGPDVKRSMVSFLSIRGQDGGQGQYPSEMTEVDPDASIVTIVDRTDNFLERAVDGSINSVRNGNFTKGDVNWELGTGWALAENSANCRTGRNCFTFTGTSAANLVAEDYIPCIAGDEVFATYWFKVTAGTVDSNRIDIIWYDADYVQLSFDSGPSRTYAPSSYVKTGHRATAPASAVFYRIRIQADLGASSVMFVDDVFASVMRKDLVSIIDFGAIGDGTADDTAALTNAFAYCSASGKTLYMPPGTWTTSTTLTVTSGFRIIGPDWGDMQDLTGSLDVPCRIQWTTAAVTNDITGITQANPAVVTYSGADNYSNGDRVCLYGIVGMTQLNGYEFTVANVNTGANTFQLSGVDSTAMTAYSSGGTVEKATYIIKVRNATADYYVSGFNIDGLLLDGENKAYGGILYSSARFCGWGRLAVEQCRRRHVRIDCNNAEVSGFIDGRYLWIKAGSNAATLNAMGLEITGSTPDTDGNTQSVFDYITADTQIGNCVVLGDLDGTVFNSIRAETSALSSTITNITQANPAVVTYSGADNFANGDRIRIYGVVGMTQVNYREFTVANLNAGANTFELSGVNSTAYTAYSSAGTAVSAVYGLRLKGAADNADSLEYRAARKIVIGYFSGDDIFAEDGSKCVIDWVNSEGTSVTCETGASLDYNVLNRKNGKRFASARYVLDDYYDLPLGLGVLHTGTPVYGTSGAQAASVILFDGAGATEAWQWTFPRPKKWDHGRITKVEITGLPTVTAGGNIVLQPAFIHRAMGNGFGSALSSENFTKTQGGTAGVQELHTCTLTTPWSVLDDTGMMLFRLSRLSGDAADTYGSDWGLLNVRIYFQGNAGGDETPDYRYQPSDYVATVT